MNPLQEIEKRFAFTYPALYKTLYADGMLEYSKDDYYINYSTKLLGYQCNFELADLEELSDEIATFAEYRSVAPQYQFIPFGFDSAGNHYVFWINREGAPILYMDHSIGEARICAKNLEDFIFLTLLSVASNIDNPQEWQEQATAMLARHEKYLSKPRAELLAKIYAREVRRVTLRNWSYNTVFATNEQEKIIKSQINFDEFDKELDYTN